MALNIKNAEVERLAEEISRLTGESKTEAVRRALEERKGRLAYRVAHDNRADRLKAFLEREVWPVIPEEQLGRAMSKADEEAILGYGGVGRLILDSSAVVAIALREPEFEDLLARLSAARSVGIGVPTLAETATVLSARISGDARGLLARFLQEGNISTVPFGDAHFGVGVEAWLRYGKGRHPAALNFGDCMAYAVAKVADEPLLCRGDDFPKTDLALA